MIIASSQNTKKYQAAAGRDGYVTVTNIHEIEVFKRVEKSKNLQMSNGFLVSKKPSLQ